MDTDPVVVGTYPTEIAAELARVTLDAEGIPALVQTADAAGLLRFVQGVQLVVRRADLEAARSILEAQRETSDDV
jgi:hypothetical protein